MKTLKSKEYLNRKTLSGAINSAKTQLIKFAVKHGIYENFGQDQVQLIRDKFINISCYSKEMNLNRDKILYFSNWCMSYNMN